MRRLTLVTNPDKCNLRCPLCFLNQRGFAYGKGEMPLYVAVAAIEKYLGLHEVIPSTMGEPLLYSKFEELLDYCMAVEIPVNLTTNGTFPGVWGNDEGLRKLVRGCSDIKVSCMGFSEKVVCEMMPGITLEKWKGNVLRLIEAAEKKDDVKHAASVSLQVTLHKKMLSQACELLAWAESVGIARIKWNLPVFISCGERLRAKYDVGDAEVELLRKQLRSDKVRSEGSLFFDAAYFADGKAGICENEYKCRIFADEVWVMPDGSVQHCPNPEKRFGNSEAPGANCAHCLMFRR